MDIYLPIAEMSVNPLLVTGIGLSVGFLSGLFGVGGGFLLTPLLTFLGVPPTIAVGTQVCQLPGTSLSGALAQWRRHNVDVRMAFILVVGSIIGTLLGMEIVKWLKQIGQINLFIVLAYVTILSIVGFLMFLESATRYFQKNDRHRGTPHSSHAKGESERGLTMGIGATSALAIDFQASRLRINVLLPIGLGIISGLLVSILGLSGMIVVPAMIYVLKMPPTMVNGTALSQLFLTATFATVMQASTLRSVDIVLAGFLLIGSVVSAPIGTKFSTILKPVVARLLMSLVVMSISGKLIYDLIVTPANLFSVEVSVLP